MFIHSKEDSLKKEKKKSSQVMCRVDIKKLLNGTSHYINEFNVLDEFI